MRHRYSIILLLVSCGTIDHGPDTDETLNSAINEIIVLPDSIITEVKLSNKEIVINAKDRSLIGYDDLLISELCYYSAFKILQDRRNIETVTFFINPDKYDIAQISYRSIHYREMIERYDDKYGAFLDSMSHQTSPMMSLNYPITLSIMNELVKDEGKQEVDMSYIDFFRSYRSRNSIPLFNDFYLKVYLTLYEYPKNGVRAPRALKPDKASNSLPQNYPSHN
ncbi:MAG: hypothetical protein R2817_01985 [Flavobacteriales bacterium]